MNKIEEKKEEEKQEPQAIREVKLGRVFLALR